MRGGRLIVTVVGSVGSSSTASCRTMERLVFAGKEEGLMERNAGRESATLSVKTKVRFVVPPTFPWLP
jgi:hypothetical protein